LKPYNHLNSYSLPRTTNPNHSTMLLAKSKLTVN
jgi:hypothetical protein